MSEILVIYAHPNPKRSRLNQRLVHAARDIDGVQVHDLYERYPNLHVDVMAEQEALHAASVVVMQFPVYWFSAPALLKEWQDAVLTKGFAFGRGGTALAGKNLMLALSTGGGLESYRKGESHGAKIQTYLAPFEQTALFCGMQIEKPFIVQGVGDLSEAELNQATQDYITRLKALLSGGKAS